MGMIAVKDGHSLTYTGITGVYRVKTLNDARTSLTHVKSRFYDYRSGKRDYNDYDIGGPGS